MLAIGSDSQPQDDGHQSCPSTETPLPIESKLCDNVILNDATADSQTGRDRALSSITRNYHISLFFSGVIISN
jgi:hypothetical protein